MSGLLEKELNTMSELLQKIGETDLGGSAMSRCCS